MTNDAVRARLQAERARILELQAAATRLHSDNSEEEGEGMHPDSLPSEKATETIGREIDESVAIHAEAELGEIDAALERLDAGTYGKCENCGEPIKPGRLEIMPAARFCVDDQAKAERAR